MGDRAVVSLLTAMQVSSSGDLHDAIMSSTVKVDAAIQMNSIYGIKGLYKSQIRGIKDVNHRAVVQTRLYHTIVLKRADT